MSQATTQNADNSEEVILRTNDRGVYKIEHRQNGSISRVNVGALSLIAAGEDYEDVFDESFGVCYKNGVKWDNGIENVELRHVSEWLHHEDIDRTGPRPKAQTYTREELLDWIDTYVEVFGVVPIESEFKTNGFPGPSASPYKREFGTFVKAVRAAGYTPRGDKR